MQRIRLVLDEVPIKKILKKVFLAKMSLRHGISARTIDNYMETLIDAGKVVYEDKFIWLKG